MKITCEGCSAKYSVADAKVRGRAFKIRCKRCGAAIVVRGESLAEGAAWHVLVSGAEQGPMGIEQVRALFAAGSIDGASYVWKEGFAEWRALRDVDELCGVGRGVDRGVEPGADLFAIAGPFAPEPSEGAPSAIAESASLTGTRNESSVLFSLSNLQALSAPAAERAPASRTTAPRTTAKEGGSGLIDIRALASAPVQPAATSASVDDLLSIGSLASPLGPPVIVARPERSSRAPLFVAAFSAAGALLAAAAVIIAVILGNQSETRAADRVQGGPIVASEETPPDAVEPALVAPPTETTEPEPPAPAATVADVPTPSVPRAEAPRRARRDRDEPAAPVAVRRPSEAPMAARRPTDDAPDIGRLLDLDARPDPTPRREPDAPRGPVTPSRSNVTSAMASVAGAVRACGNGARGMAPVRLVFRGDTGRVTSAEVNAPSLPPEVRSCIARAARGARVPPFTQDTFRVDYPFSL